MCASLTLLCLPIDPQCKADSSSEGFRDLRGRLNQQKKVFILHLNYTSCLCTYILLTRLGIMLLISN